MLADDGSCLKHGIPPKAPSRIYLPNSYQDRVDAQTYNMLSKQGGYMWLVRNVKSHTRGDCKKSKLSSEDRAYATFLTKNNSICHGIAQQILDILIERRMFDDGAIDDAGGRLPHGFGLREHGGVFGLSLDRINNSRAHFLEGKPATANLRLVALGMNTRANIVANFGPKTCEVLRANIAEQHSTVNVERILERAHHRSVKRGLKHVLYKTCEGAFCNETDLHKQYLNKTRTFDADAIAAMEQFQKDFPRQDSLFQHVLQMFKE